MGLSSAQWAELMEEDSHIDYAAGHDPQEVEQEEVVLQAGCTFETHPSEQCMHTFAIKMLQKLIIYVCPIKYSACNVLNIKYVGT